MKLTAQEKEKRLIVVLGMHRSGTSVVTRGLQVMGVDLGNRLMPPREGDNEKGYYEDMDLYMLNEEMLYSLNTDWHHLTPILPSDVEVLREKGYLLRAVDILRNKTSETHIFGFKDPRVAKLLPFWKEVFAESRLHISYVIVMRNPLSVSESLAKRDGFDFEKSHLLWMEHVINSLVETEGKIRVLVDYDRLLQSPEMELERIAKELQFETDPAELEEFKKDFLDMGLRHTVYQFSDLVTDVSVPPLVQEVYSNILSIASDVEKLNSAVLAQKIKGWKIEYIRQRSALMLVDKLTVKMQQDIADLSLSLAERDQQITALTELANQLSSIKRSRSWRVYSHLVDIYSSIFPQDSWQARILNGVMPILLYLPSKIWLKFRQRKDSELIRSSDLYDEDWYLKQYPDLKQARITPIHHYLLFGGFEGRNPGPNFDSGWYLETYPEVKLAGINPLVHYLRSGRQSGRQPLQAFLSSKGKTRPFNHPQQMKNAEMKIEDVKGNHSREKTVPKDSANLSIVIPVYNKLSFTKQCIERIERNTSPDLYNEIIIVDAGSTDGTEGYFSDLQKNNQRIVYYKSPVNLSFAKACNVGAALSERQRLVFLNNDTLVQPDWLKEMLKLINSDSKIGIVGIKQLFPYTNLIYHTGIVFTADRGPQHLYPHTDANLPHVNKQREYQAINGACFLIDNQLFKDCECFDENYVNGYEDIDLCMAVKSKSLKIICCTSAYIYHYGQITREHPIEDDKNAKYFYSKWKNAIKIDEHEYFQADARDIGHSFDRKEISGRTKTKNDAICFVDNFSTGNSFTWANVDLIMALMRLGAPVHIKKGMLTESLGKDVKRELQKIMVAHPDPDGVQIKWSHYWPQHLSTDLRGRINLEFFVINYFFAQSNNQPWDYWMQSLKQDRYHKLPLAKFCKDVLLQIGVAEAECSIFPLGYSREVNEIGPNNYDRDHFHFFTVTNSHDLERYGTQSLLEAYWETFGPKEPVKLVIKDYGAGSGNTSLNKLIQNSSNQAQVVYVDKFLTKKDLIRLYRDCDAFVSPHRSEGFGMKILDAMACGTPVITPLFGGPVDYCNNDNCFPVDFRIVPMGDCLDTHELQINNQPMWCEPNWAHLKETLRFAFENPTKTKAIGELGRLDVIDRFTWDNAAKRLLNVIDHIKSSQ